MTYQAQLGRKLEDKSEETSQQSREIKKWKSNREWSDKVQMHVIEGENRDSVEKQFSNK